MSQSYLPLFRKYRPQSFKDIVGQEHLVKALVNAIQLNRIANAYLFCGPRGTGKTSTARILAKSLNCEHGPTTEPCQKCASCVDITNATGIDVIEIDAASNRGIQDAKELIAQVQYAPINGKYKIFIIDEVHMLSNDAFNALLKTFEEPPENVIFILATTEPHKVLETIVSRCQRFDLRRITIEDIIKRLREISNLEKIKITDSALYTIAKNVSGGLRDSLALLDQVSILGVKEEIDKELIEELLGKIHFDILLELLKNINEKNIEKSISKINDIYSKGNEPKNLAENFMEFLRNVILILNSEDNENIFNLTNLVSDDIEKIRNLSFKKEDISNILNIFIEYYKEIKISTNPYLWTELAAIASCNSNKVYTEQNENEIISQKEKTASVKKNTFTTVKTTQTPPPSKETSDTIFTTVKTTQTPPPSKETSDTTDAIENNIELSDNEKSQNSANIWLNVLNNIKSIPANAFYKEVAKLIEIKNNKIILGFLHDNAIAQAKSPLKLNQLQTAIKSVDPNLKEEFIKIDATVKITDITQAKKTFSSPLPEKKHSKITENKKNETKPEEETSKQERNRYSEEVQEMIEQFNGRIIE